MKRREIYIYIYIKSYPISDRVPHITYEGARAIIDKVRLPSQGRLAVSSTLHFLIKSFAFYKHLSFFFGHATWLAGS